VFWDFDGVIKESVGVKTAAYVQLFGHTAELAARVRTHHELNGGVSRFEKIPLYLGWGGQALTAAAIEAHCAAFAGAVRQAVIDAPWVPGVREYLAAHHERQRFVLVTATPQAEMIDILDALHIGAWFREVHGAPTPKAAAVVGVLRRWRCAPQEAVFVGDARSDYQAASDGGIDFLLRRTALNGELQKTHAGLQCEDFLHG
jgi:phosphoglycolate phosphatase-like HAD superfamily hydrolase